SRHGEVEIAIDWVAEIARHAGDRECLGVIGDLGAVGIEGIGDRLGIAGKVLILAIGAVWSTVLVAGVPSRKDDRQVVRRLRGNLQAVIAEGGVIDVLLLQAVDPAAPIILTNHRAHREFARDDRNVDREIPALVDPSVLGAGYGSPCLEIEVAEIRIVRQYPDHTVEGGRSVKGTLRAAQYLHTLQIEWIGIRLH